MFLKSEHLSFPSSYFLILDSSVQKYFGESGGGPALAGAAALLPAGLR